MENILNKQRNFFKEGKTLDIKFRKEALLKLKESVFTNLEDLVKAFKEDYNKCEFDVYSTEVGLVIREINYFIRNLNKLSKPKKVRTSLGNIGYVKANKLINEVLSFTNNN
jgi:aldehyde dehydrogenase (NAD+)